MKPEVPPTTVVIFGASGDLARRKLLPGLFHLFREGMLPERFAVPPRVDVKYRMAYVGTVSILDGAGEALGIALELVGQAGEADQPAVAP